MTAAVAGFDAVKARHRGEEKHAANAAPKLRSVKTDIKPAVKPATITQSAVRTNSKTSSKSSGKTPSFSFGVGKVSKYRQIIAAEIIVGGIIILLEPTSSQSDTDFAQSVEQLAAFLMAFFVLSLMTTAGANAARISATLGGILVLAILLRPKNMNLLTNIIPPGFRKARTTTPTTVTPTVPSLSTDSTATTQNIAVNPNSLGRPIGQAGGVYSA